VAAALTIIEAIRNRRVEIVAVVMFGLFLFGLAATFLTGDPRMLVLKDSVVTGVVALAFIATTLVDRPLLFLLGRKFETGGDPVAVAAFEDRYATHAPTRRRFTVLSYAWGLGLLLEAAVRTVLCFTLPIDEMVALSPVLLFGSITVIYLAAKVYLARARD
jgi:intracellular septation protein A